MHFSCEQFAAKYGHQSGLSPRIGRKLHHCHSWIYSDIKNCKKLKDNFVHLWTWMLNLLRRILFFSTYVYKCSICLKITKLKIQCLAGRDSDLSCSNVELRIYAVLIFFFSFRDVEFVNERMNWLFQYPLQRNICFLFSVLFHSTIIAYSSIIFISLCLI